jgi:hypothetical protein
MVKGKKRQIMKTRTVVTLYLENRTEVITGDWTDHGLSAAEVEEANDQLLELHSSISKLSFKVNGHEVSMPVDLIKSRGSISVEAEEV